MSNVIKFPFEVRRCKTPSEADVIINSLNMQNVRHIGAARINGDWVVSIRYMTDMERAVANAKLEYKQ